MRFKSKVRKLVVGLCLLCTWPSPPNDPIGAHGQTSGSLGSVLDASRNLLAADGQPPESSDQVAMASELAWLPSFLFQNSSRTRRAGRQQQQQQQQARAQNASSSTDSHEPKQAAGRKRTRSLRILVTAIHVDKAEFPLGRLLFRLTLELALSEANKYLEKHMKQAGNKLSGHFDKLELALNVRSANTCSRQFAAALAAEEYYRKRARSFIVSGCDDAIRDVSRLASQWRVPIMTAAGFGADLGDKSVHKSLVRVAFSLQAAVEFLFKIMKMFHWSRANLVVDESDPNSLALKESVANHLAGHHRAGGSRPADLAAAAANFSVHLNTIVLDLKALSAARAATSKNAAVAAALGEDAQTMDVGQQQHQQHQSDDKWPNEITEQAIDDTLWRCSRFSRVTILLISQRHLRKFMLSAYDQNMANGHYTFINMPLLPIDDRLSEDELPAMANTGGGGGGASGDASSEHKHPLPPVSHAGYTAGGGRSAAAAAASAGLGAATGENEFVWRSLQPRARNAHAKHAFESLMSIYLRTPTTKAYVYFVSNLNNLANANQSPGVAPSSGSNSSGAGSAMVAPLAGQNSSWSALRDTGPAQSAGKAGTGAAATPNARQRIKLNTSPYSASFYDSLLIYARTLHESLVLETGNGSSASAASKAAIGRPSLARANAMVSKLIRNRRFDNMATGSVFINANGDRETDFTLDDMNEMTGKFAPVILFRGETREIERVGRIHWSSDSSGE
jgi:hypothetical protein